MFKKYVSNVALGTGTNYILELGEPKKIRVRAFLRPEMPGDFNWKIFYINQVNSTFSDGSVAYRGKSGGSFRINYAKIADGGELSATPDVTLERVWTPLTFSCETFCDVTPDARIESDASKLALTEGHYLAFEWELEGDGIPCTPDSQAAVWVDCGEGFRYGGNAPLPACFACDRPYKKKIAFLGDSITQGCGTTPNGYDMWAGRIAAMLPEYSVWNLGLGYGRGADFLASPSWVYKAKQNDIVVMTYGVNDILHGAYQCKRSSAGEVVAMLENNIRELKNAGVEVILSTVPPFDFSPEQYREWRAVNLAIPAIAKLHGCRIYDIESSLDLTGSLGCKHFTGAHPNGEGGRIAAEFFKKTFHDGSNWML